MEPDIILEGFKQAEEVHAVRYKRFVGDGDSSVYPTLILDGDDILRSWSVQTMPVNAKGLVWRSWCKRSLSTKEEVD